MAQITITIRDALIPRIRAAFQTRLELDHLATTEEIEAYVKQNLRAVVIEHEAAQEMQAEQARISRNKWSEEW